MASLWRTQRPRFTLYQSDGLGRDYYIKYTNGGFWENQFVISKKHKFSFMRLLGSGYPIKMTKNIKY